jgi:ATP-binding cassette subfamily B protein
MCPTKVGEIREDLLFVKLNATEAEMLDALQLASTMSLVARAELGLELPLGESGLSVSGDERQRFSIARALLRESCLFIFEATSALDSITAKQITE